MGRITDTSESPLSFIDLGKDAMKSSKKLLVNAAQNAKK
jgi:hypothetical protein